MAWTGKKKTRLIDRKAYVIVNWGGIHSYLCEVLLPVPAWDLRLHPVNNLFHDLTGSWHENKTVDSCTPARQSCWNFQSTVPLSYSWSRTTAQLTV